MKLSTTWVGVVCCLVACGNDRPPPSGAGGQGGSSSGGSSSNGSGGGGAQGNNGGSGGASSSGGSGASASSGSGGSSSGGAGEAGAPAMSTTGPATTGGTVQPEVEACEAGEPPAAALCDPMPGFGEEQTAAIVQMGAEQLVAITPDELTLVWFAAGSVGGQFLLADRASVEEDFGEPKPLAQAGVLGISPDGLRLVLRSDDRRSLLESVRPARGEAFGEAEEGAFALLNAAALTSTLFFERAVVSPDDGWLAYSAAATEQDEGTLYLTSREGDEHWPEGELLAGCEFKAYGVLRRQPTGISADGLTLFFYDATSQLARAAWRDTTSQPFHWFVDLGEWVQVQATNDCDRLYFSTVGEQSEIVFADAD